MRNINVNQAVTNPQPQDSERGTAERVEKG